MSILRPINYAGANEFKAPVPCPTSDIAGGPRVSISFNETWIPAVLSALKVLTRPEAYVGTKTDINRCTSDAHNLLSTTGGSMPVGSIIPHVLSALPSNWINCDGTSHLRTDWPELYAVIGAAWIIDADHFIVPDFQGRVPVGSGAGPGLTPRSPNNSGGEETHVLTQAETPSHTHTVPTQGVAGAVGTLSLTRYAAAPTSTLATSSIGSGSAHQNMPPFMVVKFAVVGRET